MVLRSLAKARRFLVSQFSHVKLSSRKNGISCYVRTRDDEWLFLSLESIKDFADEVIICDTTGSSLLKNKLSRFAEKQKMNIVYRFIQPEMPKSVFGTENDMKRQTITGLAESTYKWIFEWNADFIAVEEKMRELRTSLLELGEKEKLHHYFFVPMCNLEGDIYHGRIIKPASESYLYRHSAELLRLGETAKVVIPKYYRLHSLEEVYFFHVDIKDAERMLYRHYWLDWNKSPQETLQNYVKSKILDDFGTKDIKKAAKLHLASHVRELKPLNLSLDEYPRLIRENLKAFDKYELITSNGVIIGRRDVGNFV